MRHRQHAQFEQVVRQRALRASAPAMTIPDTGRHYVTAFFLFITRYALLFDDRRGYLVAGFSLMWLANIYMSFVGRLRLEIREDRLDIAAAESRSRPDVMHAQDDPGPRSGRSSS